MTDETKVSSLLKARAEIDQQLRQHKTELTVVFTDVVGSTKFIDRYGDTAGLSMLQRHNELASNCFQEFQGKIIKTIGDSVMADFPSPAAAVRAAVEVQRRLLKVNETLPEHERTQLRVGINLGTGFRRAGDVYGDAVHVAARVTKNAGAAQILISRSVRERTASEPDINAVWAAKILFEGKSEPDDVYEIIWTDQAHYEAIRKRFGDGTLAQHESAPTPEAPAPVPMPAPATIVSQPAPAVAPLPNPYPYTPQPAPAPYAAPVAPSPLPGGYAAAPAPARVPPGYAPVPYQPVPGGYAPQPPVGPTPPMPAMMQSPVVQQPRPSTLMTYLPLLLILNGLFLLAVLVVLIFALKK